MSSVCDICGDGSVELKTEKTSVQYADVTGQIDTQYLLCDTCGSEHSRADQLRANKRAMLAFKKQVDGLLSGTEIRDIRVRFGMSIADAGEHLGGGPVAFSKYENDDIIHSAAMETLLRFANYAPRSFKSFLDGDTKSQFIVDVANSSPLLNATILVWDAQYVSGEFKPGIPFIHEVPCRVANA